MRPFFHVAEHPLGLRVILDRLAAPTFESREIVDFLHVPTPDLGVGASAGQVVLGAFTFGLIVGGDANPDADGFGFNEGRSRGWRHDFLSVKRRAFLAFKGSGGKKKIAVSDNFLYSSSMAKQKYFTESDLAALAKEVRVESGQAQS